ncbi:hypothetical protein AAG570_004565 [Ranatra chinensis]|uniref:Uncharacterized protein n=1 Tax=Ranatra chinensis TaxID=642074 RepID=A0ABD0YN27_9HEMI
MQKRKVAVLKKRHPSLNFSSGYFLLVGGAKVFKIGTPPVEARTETKWGLFLTGRLIQCGQAGFPYLDLAVSPPPSDTTFTYTPSLDLLSPPGTPHEPGRNAPRANYKLRFENTNHKRRLPLRTDSRNYTGVNTGLQSQENGGR